MRLPYLIIDFDNTFVTLEGLDELAKIALKGHPDETQIIGAVATLTKQGMEGKIDFAKALEQRLKLFKANREHIKQLVALLQQHVTPSITRNHAFFERETDRIYIISGGFIDYIWPVVKGFGIKADHVLANRFVFDSAGTVVGYDKSSLLAQNNGKTKQLKALNLTPPIHVIGDGYTDYLMASQANEFFAFTENISRPSAVNHADSILSSFDQLVKSEGSVISSAT